MTDTSTKTRPILFSAPMVRALLDGRKTQTRRIIKPQPVETAGMDCRRLTYFGRNGLECLNESVDPWPDHALAISFCPYGGPGDRLWVRESFQPLLAEGVKWQDSDYETGEGYAVNYVATGGAKEFYDFSRDEAFSDRITPSIFMPRWASRITLEITEVRVERLQDISEEDVVAEGVNLLKTNCDGECGATPCRISRQPFVTLWESINGAGSWDLNPWVWAVSFSVASK